MVFSPNASRRFPRPFDPVGKCIYCGAEPPEPLTIEHILPQGLGGGLILPAASCETCRRITHKIEEICLRSMSLLTYRLRAGLVQRPHEISDRAKGQPHFLLLPAPDHGPGILEDRQLGAPMRYHLQLAANIMPARLPQLDVRTYFRMIAKIAHAFAVSQIGIDAFDGDLPHIILRDVAPITPYLIGKSEITLPIRPDTHSHQLGLGLTPRGGGHLVTVRVQLFALSRGPAYKVVAGRLSMSEGQFEERVRARPDPNPRSAPRRPSGKTRGRLRRGRTIRDQKPL